MKVVRILEDTEPEIAVLMERFFNESQVVHAVLRYIPVIKRVKLQLLMKSFYLDFIPRSMRLCQSRPLITWEQLHKIIPYKLKLAHYKAINTFHDKPFCTEINRI